MQLSKLQPQDESASAPAAAESDEAAPQETGPPAEEQEALASQIRQEYEMLKDHYKQLRDEELELRSTPRCSHSHVHSSLASPLSICFL